MLSMTGFAIKTMLLTTADGARTHVTMSLKSLNSRYFEVICKLPQTFQFFETEFIKLFKKKLHRGHVIFSIQLSNPNVFKGPVQPDVTLAKNYVEAIELIKGATDIKGSITLSDIINLPNIFSIEESVLDEKTKTTILNAIDNLIEQLITERKQEGTVLAKDIEQRILVIDREIQQIEKEAELLMQRRKKEMTEKLLQLEKSNTTLTDAQRATLFFDLDKIDIHEEITRFKNHLRNFSVQLHSQEIEKGRRLDFIIQEMGREINTITAKCSDSGISSLAINIKVELEKIREQIQNIV